MRSKTRWIPWALFMGLNLILASLAGCGDLPLSLGTEKGDGLDPDVSTGMPGHTQVDRVDPKPPQDFRDVPGRTHAERLECESSSAQGAQANR